MNLPRGSTGLRHQNTESQNDVLCVHISIIEAHLSSKEMDLIQMGRAIRAPIGDKCLYERGWDFLRSVVI